MRTRLALKSLCCTAAMAAGATAETTQSQPNIVMLFSDEYDFSHVGAFGGRFPTPNIDRLASQGVRLTEAYSVSSVCNPSRFSVLTGLFPSNCRTEFIRNYSRTPGTLNAGFVFGVDRQTPSIARMLSAAGYRTAFFGKWGVQGDPSVLPQNTGFLIPPKIDPDTPEGDAALREWQTEYSRWIRASAGFDHAATLYDNVTRAFPEKIRHHHIEWITQGVLDFMDAEKTGGKPFYLHICPTTIHGPSHARDLDADPSYTPGGRTTHHLNAHPSRNTIAKRLDAAGVPINDDSVGMMFLDDMVGAIMKKLDEEGLAKNTLFFLMPDHNVEPGKATCLQKGTHVPVIIRWPGKIKPGSVCDQRISYVDMVPTILEAAETAPVPDYTPDGLSLVPALTQGAKIDRDFLYFEMYTARGILAGDYKFIAYRYNQPMINKMKGGQPKVALDYSGSENNLHSTIAIRYAPGYFDLDQLYNVKKDIWEQQNLAANPEYKQLLEQMRGKLVDFTQRFDKPFDPAIDPYCETDAFKALVEKRKASSAKKNWWHNDYRYRSKVLDLENQLDGM